MEITSVINTQNNYLKPKQYDESDKEPKYSFINFKSFIVKRD